MKHLKDEHEADVLNLPYHEMGDLPEDFTMGNVVKRMIDGLGYRFYWSTEGLTDNDLNFRISEGSRSTLETMDHVLELSGFILRVAQGKYSGLVQSKETLRWNEIRAQTLIALKEASDLYAAFNDEEFKKLEMLLQKGENKFSMPLWMLLNGPIADAMHHVGQICSFRRASGNPIDPKVDAFTGKNRP